MRQCIRRVTIVAAAGLLMTTAGGGAPARAQSADAELFAALERLRDTGQPVHTDHDEGELLQWELDRRLPGNPDLLRAARRAAAPITAQLAPPISSPGDLPAVSISSRTILQRPASERYAATIAVSVDGGEWLELCDVRPDASCGRNLESVPGLRVGPGFHELAVQARIRHEDGDTETRTLPSLAFAVADRSPARPRDDPSAFLGSAVALSTRALSGALPEMSLGAWLESLRTSDVKVDTILWRSAWCGLGIRSELAETDMRQLCAVAMVAAGRPGPVGEIWIRVGSVEPADGRIHWQLSEPSLERVLVRIDRSISLPSIDLLPVLLREPQTHWPAADVSIDPVDITFEPLEISGAGAQGSARTYLARAIVRNQGDAPASGLTFTLMTGSREDRLILRRFVRDVPARGTVELHQRVTVPAGYGWLLLHALPLSDHAPSGEWDPIGDLHLAMSFRVVNPDLAPPGFARWIADRFCAHQCRGF